MGVTNGNQNVTNGSHDMVTTCMLINILLMISFGVRDYTKNSLDYRQILTQKKGEGCYFDKIK